MIDERDREFWLVMRQAVLIVLAALEARLELPRSRAAKRAGRKVEGAGG